MGIKVYISGISGNKEVKKRQQRVVMILDSKNIKYEVIDIAEPGAEEAKDFMQNNSTANGATISDPNPRHPLPPQLFNDEIYCGDYDMFDMANEIDEMEKFLKLEVSDVPQEQSETQIKNGDILKDDKPLESEIVENSEPTEQVDEELNKIEEPKLEENAIDNEEIANGSEEQKIEEVKETSPEKADE